TKNFSMTRTLLHKDSVSLSKIYIHPDFKHEENYINNINDFLKLNNKVTIIAKGGSGKTTFLKKLYIDTLSSFEKIPLILNLRDFNHLEIKRKIDEASIKNNFVFKALANQLVESKVTIDSKLTEKMFQSGRFYILFDGFDEIDVKYQSIITNHLINFVNRFNDNKYIVTTRPYTNATNLLGFENINLEGLDTFEKKDTFISKQLFTNPNLANKIITSLKDEDAQKYIELLNNPLFLILFINSFEYYPNIPMKKSDFYWQVFDALCERHDNFSKLGFERPKFSNITKDQFKNILERFCCITYFHNLFNFKEFEILIKLEKIKNTEKYVFNRSEYLNDLKISIPLLVQDGNDFYFIRRSIQEYFTALYVNNLIANENYEFLEELAQEQNEKNGSHTFLLELISEMYPPIFKKYYIPYHLEYFFSYFDEYLVEHKQKNSYNRIFNSYKEFKNILTFCIELKQPLEDFIKQHTYHNPNVNLILGANSKDELKIAEEIMILNENRHKFYSKINSILKTKEESTNNLWRYAVSKR